MASSPIPGFYRFFFTVIDPLLPLFGAVAHAFYPEFILKGVVASPQLPPRPETQLMLDYTAGFFLLLAFQQAVLLRVRPNDVTVWKLVQFSTLLLDIGVVGAFLRALNTQGRLDIGRWRGDEYNQVFGNGAVGLIRLLFVLGVGMGRGKGKKA